MARTLYSLCLFVFALAPTRPALAICLDPPGDVTADGVTNVTDVQCNVLANLWSLAGQTGPVPVCIAVPGSPSVVTDHNCDSVVNVADTQLAVAFSFLTPLAPQLDANANACVDACESDLDADGDFDLVDCAPQDPAIHAGAQELCNGYDDDCDGTNDEAVATVAASCASASLCVANGTCPAGPETSGMLITEIAHSPDGVADSLGEWFELYNGGNAPQNIQGWILSDGDGESHVIDAGGALFVPAHGYLVLGRSKEMAKNGGVRVAYVYSGITFDGASDSLKLSTPQGLLIAQVVYNLSSGMPVMPGRSLALRALDAPMHLAASWAASTRVHPSGDRGTPAGPNADVAAARCEGGSPVVCADGNPCTTDSCAPQTGCVFTPNSAPCGATGPCFVSGVCAQGSCQGGVQVNCNDNNSCTQDSCNPASGCVYLPQSGACEDGNLCTTLDVCVNGACLAGIPALCFDANPCTADGCSPQLGCTYAPSAGMCEDGVVCTELDVCISGVCVGGIPKVCDDGSPCTQNACHPTLGCIFSPLPGPCSDGSACTVGETCQGGQCTGGAALVCNDGNPCTADSCSAALGCVYAPNAAPCNDGNPCTLGDVCSGGACASGTQQAACDDGNPCTEDLCLPSVGCVSEPWPDGSACGTTGDGFACSLDGCLSGVCEGIWLSPVIYNTIPALFSDILHVGDGFIMVGYRNVAPGSKTFWLMKTDLQGDILWERQLDPATHDEGIKLEATGDGGFVAVGTPGDRLIRFDGLGNQVWSQTYETGGAFWGVDTRADGGFIAVGWTSNTFGTGDDVWLVRTNGAGGQVWTKKYHNGISDRMFDVVTLPDGGALAAGYTAPAVGDIRGYLLRVNSSGIKTWDKVYTTGTYSAFSAIEPASDGGFILAGRRTLSSTKAMELWMVKLDSALNEQWSVSFGGNKSDDAQDVMQAKDGGFVAVGQYQTVSQTGVVGQRPFVVKVNAQGTKQWEFFNPSISGWANGVTFISDEGGVAVAGWNFSPNPLLFFLDNNGTVCQ